MSVTQTRKIVWNILAAVNRGRRLDRSLEEQTQGLEQKDKAWSRKVSYGILRFRGRIDHILRLNIRRGFDDVDPAVLNVLRIGLYETFYMDGIPRYAAVSQAVELAKVVGKSSAGFVNAVLRSSAKGGVGQENFPEQDADPVGYFSTWGSHPDWLIERWLSRWSAQEVGALVAVNNRVPPIFLNYLQEDTSTAITRLENSGIQAEEIEGTSCVVLKTTGSLERAMTLTSSIVQDPAAALVPAYMDVEGHELVVDLCAAPGGKTLALAAKGNPVIASDLSFDRLMLLRSNLFRLQGLTANGRSLDTKMVQGDACQPFIKKAAAILVDVPCTGTGTLRRNPDIRWKISEKSIGEMAIRQSKILDSVVELIPVDGILVYSTCSLELEENSDQIKRFLETYPHFRLEPGKGVDGKYLDYQGQLHVLPQEFGFDGSFAARMRRIS